MNNGDYGWHETLDEWICEWINDLMEAGDGEKDDGKIYRNMYKRINGYING